MRYICLIRYKWWIMNKIVLLAMCLIYSANACAVVKKAPPKNYTQENLQIAATVIAYITIFVIPTMYIVYFRSKIHNPYIAPYPSYNYYQPRRTSFHFSIPDTSRMQQAMRLDVARTRPNWAGMHINNNSTAHNTIHAPSNHSTSTIDPVGPSSKPKSLFP